MKQDDDGFALTPEVPGQLMAQTYTRFATMALFVNAPAPLEMYDVLMLLANVRLLDNLIRSHSLPTRLAYRPEQRWHTCARPCGAALTHQSLGHGSHDLCGDVTQRG